MRIEPSESVTKSGLRSGSDVEVEPVAGDERDQHDQPDQRPEAGIEQRARADDVRDADRLLVRRGRGAAGVAASAAWAL